MFRADRWTKENAAVAPAGGKRTLYVFIPILDEVRRIPGTVAHFMHSFSHLDVKIVLITTEHEFVILKERSAEGVDSAGKNTINVARELAAQYPNVLWMHYPETHRKMADQLNFAIRKVFSERSNIHDNTLCAVYNADSKPHPRTLDWVLGTQDKYHASVFQQYGNYLGNAARISRSPLLLAAAVWQTRWSIGFELPHAIHALRFPYWKRTWSLSQPFNYCIGHGLFFTKKIFLKLGGFDERTHNEDAIFGLKLSYLKERIVPIPYFDESETTDSARSLYGQQASWFLGPLYAFSYRRIITERAGRDFPRDPVLLTVLCAKLFSHAIYWLIGPAALFTMIAVAIFFPGALMIGAAVSAWASFLVIPHYLALRIIRRDDAAVGVSRLAAHASALFGTLPFYAIHGLGAFRGLVMGAGHLMFNKVPRKTKTKMQS